MVEILLAMILVCVGVYGYSRREFGIENPGMVIR